ncbi:MAG: TetR/AcrR family transcriptional regulator [Leadbetterella sp.]|nr:TetR/AcrR family transcriptional regulator [Leadbetterella sp.]
MTTEEKIITAAEEVFIEHGFDGARMQLIADKAEINKAMLHYYFRSKEMLFEKIFEEKVKNAFPQMGEQMKNIDSFTERVCFFIEQYYGMLVKYPYLPLFVISTFNKKENKKFVQKMPFGFIKEFFFESFFQDTQSGKIREVNPFQFAVSIMGMCVFPFLARPAMKELIGINDEQFQMLMQQRIDELKNYVRLILTPTNHA